MKKFVFIATIACAACMLYGCDKSEDGGGPAVSPRAEAALLARYPAATDVVWRTSGNYSVAEFSLPAVRAAVHGGRDHAAWFDDGGEWYMTETDIVFGSLPSAVQAAFRDSEYAGWRIDDVDMLEREGVETVYVIEAEGRSGGRETEVDLYYSSDGVLVKKVVDADSDYDYGDYIPARPTGEAESFVQTRYPGARILDVERENGMTEVEILDGTVCRELLFDATNSWVHTKTELNAGEVPASIMQALSASEYGGYRIDDVDRYETPQKEFYRFDLESASGDVKIDIALDGTLSVVTPEISGPGTGNGSMLDDAAARFIAEKYPNALGLEFDWDDGLLEVEIYHEGKEKSVCFDGAGRWVKTEWDVRLSELPDAVRTAIAGSQYASYRVDDIEYVQTSGTEYYRIELERGDSEATLRVDASGNML